MGASFRYSHSIEALDSRGSAINNTVAADTVTRSAFHLPPAADTPHPGCQKRSCHSASSQIVPPSPNDTPRNVVARRPSRQTTFYKLWSQIPKGQLTRTPPMRSPSPPTPAAHFTCSPRQTGPPTSGRCGQCREDQIWRGFQFDKHARPPPCILHR